VGLLLAGFRRQIAPENRIISQRESKVLDLWTDLLACLQLRVEDGSECSAANSSGSSSGRQAQPVPTRPSNRSPLLAHGRCFGRGDVLTEEGLLVASYAQEALLRFRDA
jgi:hypothetical protein